MNILRAFTGAFVLSFCTMAALAEDPHQVPGEDRSNQEQGEKKDKSDQGGQTPEQKIPVQPEQKVPQPNEQAIPAK